MRWGAQQFADGIEILIRKGRDEALGWVAGDCVDLDGADSPALGLDVVESLAEGV